MLQSPSRVVDHHHHPLGTTPRHDARPDRQSRSRSKSALVHSWISAGQLGGREISCLVPHQRDRARRVDPRTGPWSPADGTSNATPRAGGPSGPARPAGSAPSYGGPTLMTRLTSAGPGRQLVVIQPDISLPSTGPRFCPQRTPFAYAAVRPAAASRAASSRTVACSSNAVHRHGSCICRPGDQVDRGDGVHRRAGDRIARARDPCAELAARLAAAADTAHSAKGVRCDRNRGPVLGQRYAG